MNYDPELFYVGAMFYDMGIVDKYSSNTDHFEVLPGMHVVGVSAGILNGETAKVLMSAILPARAGEDSGVGGTIRFARLVAGFAALGAILFNRVGSGIIEKIGPLNSDQFTAL